ncbi:MAG: hypothetical protein E7519_15915 [Ruminococcaceae bacterium]|nr:hypothetical protein [Oscillospiraceae bacterium]
MRDKYWAMYTSIKHDEYYYESYQIRAKRINALINGFCLLLSVGSVASWGIWGKIPIFWALLIGMSQIVSTLKPLFPFSNQIIATKYLLPELRSLLNDIDFDWNITHLLSDKEVLKLIYKYNKKFDKLELKYINQDYFPFVKSCDDDAEKESKKFFYHTYDV